MRCSETGNYSLESVGASGHEVCNVEDEHDSSILKQLNPDYVRTQALDSVASRRMILTTQSLNETFNQGENAKRWLYAQIMKCAMMAATVVPDARMVDEFASVILQMYGRRPIAHLALFFGYAQVRRHFTDDEQIEHYGTFDLSSLLQHLGGQLRIITYKSVTTRQKMERIDSQIKMCDDVIEGRIVHPDERAAQDPSCEEYRRLPKETIAYFNSDEWRAIKRAQVENAILDRERLMRQRNELLGK